MPVISELRKQRQEDHYKLEATLGYIVSSRPAKGSIKKLSINKQTASCFELAVCSVIECFFSMHKALGFGLQHWGFRSCLLYPSEILTKYARLSFDLLRMSSVFLVLGLQIDRFFFLRFKIFYFI